MTVIYNFFMAHQVLCTVIIGYVWSAFISALPAPTASNGPLYRFWFSFFNYLAANIARANNNKVESSPNFASAMNLANAQTGELKVVVPVPVEPVKP